MTDAQTALQWVKEHPGSTVGVLLNNATPKYKTIEKLDWLYRVYYYPDGSYLMTYLNNKRQDIWRPSLR